MVMKIRTACGDFTEIDTKTGMFDLEPGQKILINRIPDEKVNAVVLGVGGYPNSRGINKLWVREESGRFSFIESERDFNVLEKM